MLLTLKQISSYTRTSEVAIYRYVKRHRVPHKKDKYGRVIVGLGQLSAYIPKTGDRQWFIKMSIDVGRAIKARGDNEN